MQAWWQMWEAGMPADLCERIIGDGLKLPPIEGTVGHGGVSVVDQTIRRSTVRWIPDAWVWLRGELDRYIRHANTVAFGFELYGIREVQFTEYQADVNAHYDWHEDLTWTGNLPYHRKLSIVVQLSDSTSYAGGDLQLEREPPDAETLRKRGTAIVIPAFHRHRVTPVTHGTRYSLVAWMDGPRFR